MLRLLILESCYENGVIFHALEPVAHTAFEDRKCLKAMNHGSLVGIIVRKNEECDINMCDLKSF